MKPFIIGDKRYAFDVTNANDLRRLERAYAQLCERQQIQQDAAASEQMHAIFTLYHDFFEAVFPGRAGELVGDVPSVSRAGQVFDRFTAYLHACIAEEEESARMLRRLYLGRDADDSAATATKASAQTAGTQAPEQT